MPDALADERLVTVVLCSDDGRRAGPATCAVRRRATVVARGRLRGRRGPGTARARGHGAAAPHDRRRIRRWRGRLPGSARSGSTTHTAPPRGPVAAALHGDATHRLWWAEPGGLDHLPAWVDAALRAHGRRPDRSARPAQDVEPLGRPDRADRCGRGLVQGDAAVPCRRGRPHPSGRWGGSGPRAGGPRPRPRATSDPHGPRRRTGPVRAHRRGRRGGHGAAVGRRPGGHGQRRRARPGARRPGPA